ncbi:WD40/YVTN/BNR-like repeat-containing protein [Halorhabdus amylolytica]|uniref:WD40/YVTN/BNR-like repeat-containing protein n=1 Tax=Halorhabdus amylolytica TaxID=2559573 RepID=UPI0010AA0402|nr:hypothetical protein [Halorhabdus amylolytica]
MVTAFVALDERVLQARDDEGWEPSVTLQADRIECLAASPDRTDRVFVGTVERGLQRSPDGGEYFQRVATDTIDDRVTAVTVSPHNPDTIWAGTEPSRVYRSTDGGDSWAHRPGLTDLPSAAEWSFPPRPDTHHVRWIEPDPHEPERLYVAIEAGALVRTDDGGRTWQDRPDGARLDNHMIATHSDAPGRVSVAAGDGFAESADGGDTWRYPQVGLDHRYVWSVAVDPADPNRIVVSAAAGARQAHRIGESFIYRRDGDGDGEWRLDMMGLSEDRTRAVLASNGGHFYAANDRGLYRRRIGKAHWDQLVDWPEEWTQSLARGIAILDV